MTAKYTPKRIFSWRRWPLPLQLALICLLLLLSGAAGSMSVVRKSADTHPPVAEVAPQPTPFRVMASPAIPQRSAYRIQLVSLSDEGLSERVSFLTQEYRPPSLDKDRGMVYYIDTGKVYSHSLVSGETQEVYVLSKQEQEIYEVQFVNPNLLYVTEGDKNYSGRGMSLTIKEINLATQTSRSLGPVETYIYGGATYILSSGEVDVVASFGGDGCGGGGHFYRIEAGVAERFATSGAGCAEGPRYLGVIPESGKLVFAEIIPGSYDPIDPDSDIRYDVLYLQDAISGEKEPLLDLKVYPDASKVILSDDRTLVGIISRKETVLYDIIERRVVNTVPLEKTGTHWWLTRKVLYGADYNGRVFFLVDLENGNLTTVPWGTIAAIGNSPMFFSMWENQPLFYIFSQIDEPAWVGY